MDKPSYGLIGKDIDHSLSPDIHNFLFEKNSLDARYGLFDIDNLQEIKEHLEKNNIEGANVTKPYKIDIMGYLDELENSAKRIGSVNTVTIERGRTVGCNTDGLGAKDSLEYFTSIKDKSILQIGAGGAGRAIAYVLSKSADVTVLNRTIKKAKKLERFGLDADKLNKKNLKKSLNDCDILINTTFVGMNEDRSLVPRSYLDETIMVFDIVYTPLKTRLLRDAKETGCETIDGLWMLIHQAVHSFKVWTDLEADPEEIRRFLMEEGS